MRTKLTFITLALIAFLSYSKALPNTWYDSAQVRIDSLRKGNFMLKVVDQDGNGIQDSVKIIHKKHEFPWGTAIDLTYNAGNSYIAPQAVAAESDSEIYQTERWAAYLTYLLPSEKGKKYRITIKLSENYFSAANARLFDAYVDGQKVIQDIDKYTWAKGKFMAFDTTINVIATDVEIKLNFQATKDNASIMGIVLSDSAGSPILRLNCGGSNLTTNDGNIYDSDLNYIDKNAALPGTSSNDWIKALMLKYCNYGVCGNQFKWSGIESTHGQLNYGPFENTLGWFQKVKWNMRAHTLLWGGTSSTDYHELPQWVGTLAPKAMYDTCKMRVIREVTRYKGIVKEYDVLNEPTHATYLQSKVGDSINWNCFKWAHEADPDAKLFVNDYNIIEYQDQTNAFVALVKKMLQNGAPVSGIGSQCHIGPNVDIANFKKRFDQLGQFGLPVKVTEFDMGAKAIPEQNQAIETSKMMRLAFSHPAIEGFIFWGLTDPAWVATIGNLINEDRTPKIVADSVYHLIHEVWSTKLKDQTDASGAYSFKGYFGEYDVLVKVGNTWKKFNVSCNKADQNNLKVLKLNEGMAVSPVLRKVSIKAPSSIELTFDKAMANPTFEAMNYKVFDTLTNYVQSAALKADDSATIVLTLKSSIKAKQYIPVSYAPGNQTSADGGMLESFGPILDETLTTAYLSSKTTVDGRVISVAFNNKLADTSVHASNFIVMVNKKPTTITQAMLNGTKDSLLLTLSKQILTSTDVITITYKPGSLQTTDGRFVTGFNAKSVTNSVLVPKFVSASSSTDGATIQLNFSNSIGDPVGQESDFIVTVNSENNQVTGAELSGTNKRVVILTLSSALHKGDVVNIAYNPGTLISSLGIPVLAFTSVVNNKTKTAIDVYSNNKIDCYPNPFDDQLFISNAKDYKSVIISDMLGKEMIQAKLNQNQIFEINTSNLRSGIYLVRMINNNSQSVYKLVKK